MKKSFIILLIVMLVGLSLPSCKKDYGNLNSPTIDELVQNATKAQLDNIVTGTESGMRTNVAMYLDVVGLIGREMYRITGADPRYLTELLGYENSKLDNNTFYLTNPWRERYRVAKNCNILIQAATNSKFVTAEERKGYLGFAKTIKAYQLLLNLNMTEKEGIRVNVADPENLGPFLSYDDSLDSLINILNEAKADLTGSTVVFPLSNGFIGFSDAAGLIKFNRALAARVYAYRKNWPEVMTALNESFLKLNGFFDLGVYHVFSSSSGDVLNLAFVPQNTTGETRVAHPSYAKDILPNDDRIGKATLRNEPIVSGSGAAVLTSDRDVWVYTTSTAPMPIIRNEELILLYAEAQVKAGGAGFQPAANAINTIRQGHGLAAYSGPMTEAALVNEILYNRRYSLFFEGHRWVDMRRYGKLNELPIDRPTDDVWVNFPRPFSEIQ